MLSGFILEAATPRFLSFFVFLARSVVTLCEGNETLQKLNESRYIENHLIGKIDRVDNVLVAKGMDLETVSIHAGDVILGRDCGGLVLACALHERCPTLIVKKLAYTQQVSAHSLKMTYVSGPPCRCNPQEFKLAVAW